MDPSGVVLVMAGAGAGSVLALLGAGRRTSDSAATAPPATERAVRTIVRDPGARLLCTMVAAEYVLVGMMDILLVLLALDLLEMSDSGPGVLNAGLGVGGLVGAAAALVLIGRRLMAPAVLLGAVVAGLPLVLAGLAGGPVAALALLTVCGAGKLFFDVATRTLIQRLLPDRLLTAVFGIAESLMMAGLAVGALLAPLLVHVLGARLAFVAAGVFLPLVGSWPPVASGHSTVPPRSRPTCSHCCAAYRCWRCSPHAWWSGWPWRQSRPLPWPVKWSSPKVRPGTRSTSWPRAPFGSRSRVST